MLHWNSSTDAQTPKNGLSYNVSVGTQPSLSDLLAPMADLNTGFHMIASTGNVSADTTWFLSGIAPGTYYFSVQAIDNGFMPGAFSDPVMVSFAPVGVNESIAMDKLCISPNPFTEKIQVVGRNSSGSLVQVYNASGRLIHESQYNGPIQTSDWQKGLYLVRLWNGEQVLTTKALKN